ncbi:hypothetical protein H4R35_005699 [Dimargaris xerosporica]|nr:hypothetical protein H4R35_005699 [Dimargaris xerosporica]
MTNSTATANVVAPFPLAKPDSTTALAPSSGSTVADEDGMAGNHGDSSPTTTARRSISKESRLRLRKWSMGTTLDGVTHRPPPIAHELPLLPGSQADCEPSSVDVLTRH